MIRSTRSRPTSTPARRSVSQVYGPVGLVIGEMQLPDQPQQPLVLDAAPGAVAGLAVVVGGRRHAQDLADRLDAEATTVRIDERAHFVRSASSAFAKNTQADFKISFARRSSKFSRRSCLISSRSSLWAAPGVSPVGLGLPHALTQRLRMHTQIRAICAIGRPDSSARRTPRATSSSGYFLALRMNWLLSRNESSFQSLREPRAAPPRHARVGSHRSPPSTLAHPHPLATSTNRRGERSTARAQRSQTRDAQPRPPAPRRLHRSPFPPPPNPSTVRVPFASPLNVSTFERQTNPSRRTTARASRTGTALNI